VAKFGNPKVLFFDVAIPAIISGSTYKVLWFGKKLSESSLANSLPVLGLNITNSSTQTIKLIINESDQSSKDIVAGASQSITGYPITDLAIRNVGSETITASEIDITIMNDMIECLRFYQAKKMGIVPYV